MTTVVKTVFDVSSEIIDGRTTDDVLSKLFEEVGELAVEVRIKNGKCYKVAGKDGIIGESVDVINCALDMIYLENPNLTEEDLIPIFQKKLDKWKGKNVLS